MTAENQNAIRRVGQKTVIKFDHSGARDLSEALFLEWRMGEIEKSMDQGEIVLTSSSEGQSYCVVLEPEDTAELAGRELRHEVWIYYEGKEPYVLATGVISWLPSLFAEKALDGGDYEYA